MAAAFIGVETGIENSSEPTRIIEEFAFSKGLHRNRYPDGMVYYHPRRASKPCGFNISIRQHSPRCFEVAVHERSGSDWSITRPRYPASC